MHTTILSLVLTILPTIVCAQSFVTKAESPGTRNTSVIYYDDDFLFLSRNFGDHRDFGGNTEPGLFVHSKAHDCWLQILEVSTKDAKLGKSQSDDPKDRKRLMMAAVGWDFTHYATKPSIGLPLKTSGSIAFPEKIDFDRKHDRYSLSFFTSWKIESAVTRLHVHRKDLKEEFDKIAKP